VDNRSFKMGFAGHFGGIRQSKARESYRDAFEALAALPEPDKEDTRQAEFETKMAETFRSLGQVMHLVQDMAVPAHTRDDKQSAGRVSAA
jgi:hypothetical protein